jgi:hypothetical protein
MVYLWKVTIKVTHGKNPVRVRVHGEQPFTAAYRALTSHGPMMKSLNNNPPGTIITVELEREGPAPKGWRRAELLT